MAEQLASPPASPPPPSANPTDMVPPSPTPAAPAQPEFDIVSTYHRLLAEDPDLTMPVAAIESLVSLLSASPTTTISETLSLLSTSTTHLKSSVRNPISLSAGTDLFQRYLITTLQRPGGGVPGLGTAGDFRSIRQHLISNGRLFVTRAKAGREKIAGFGRHFVRDGDTVLTNGGSRVVGALLKRAAEDSRGNVRFRVIYALASGERRDQPASGAAAADSKISRREVAAASDEEEEGLTTIRALRAHGVPVAIIPLSAVAYSLGKVSSVIVGAEGVVENGGIISRLGTYQMAVLAKAAQKPFYVVAESHKFVRLYPLSQYDLPIEQRVIVFKTGEGDGGKEEGGDEEEGGTRAEDAVDYTPPDLITALITESGVLTPSAVSEELIKIWF